MSVMRYLLLLSFLFFPAAGWAQSPPQLQPMPLPAELDGTLATSYVVPFGLPKVSFSADVNQEIGGHASQGRRVVVPYRERIETNYGTFTIVTILYADLLVSYTFSLTDQKKKYTEVDLHSMTLPSTGNAYTAKWSVAREGEDVDDNLVRTRYRIQSVHANGDTYVATMWVAEAYNLIVQIEGVSTVKGVASTVRFKLSNIKVGPQEPALFYPPPDFTRWGTGLDPSGKSRTDWGVQP